MGKKKKFLALLLLLIAFVEDSLQEDYEEEVFLNKCELDTAKIYDSLQKVVDSRCSSKDGDSSRDVQKIEGDAAKATQERKELNVKLADLNAFIESSIKTQAEKSEKEIRKEVISIANATSAKLQNFTLKVDADATKAKEERKELNATLADMAKKVIALGNASSKEIHEVILKVDADAAKAREERKELNATLEEMRKWIAEEFSKLSFVNAMLAAEAKSRPHCTDWKAKLGGLEPKRLTTGFYFYEQQWMIHSAARAWCEERGMRLAQFETFQEMKVVLENAPNDHSYWLGASDVGFAAGDFRWSGGAKVEKAGKETCVYTHWSAKKVADWPCTAEMHSLCEVPPEFPGCL